MPQCTACNKDFLPRGFQNHIAVCGKGRPERAEVVAIPSFSIFLGAFLQFLRFLFPIGEGYSAWIFRWVVVWPLLSHCVTSYLSRPIGDLYSLGLGLSGSVAAFHRFVGVANQDESEPSLYTIIRGATSLFGRALYDPGSFGSGFFGPHNHHHANTTFQPQNGFGGGGF